MLEIKREDLQKRYLNTKTRDLAKELGVSHNTLLSILREAKIPFKKGTERIRTKKIKVI